jgi:hypothetical protein
LFCKGDTALNLGFLTAEEINIFTKKSSELPVLSSILIELNKEGISLQEVCFAVRDTEDLSKDSFNSFKLRHLQAKFLNQDGDEYPALKGLATAAISITLVAAGVYYVSYMLKQLDATPFWILLHFIQIMYIMIMIEVNHPTNLVYFLDRFDHCKLDLYDIPEFTGIRDEIKKEIEFRPDRAAFNQIEFQYGSVLINLAFYIRILCVVILMHIALKFVLVFKHSDNEDNFFLKWAQKAKDHINHVFYPRYLIEIYIFLWLGILIEFVSTSRDSNLQKLSLMFAI